MKAIVVTAVVIASGGIARAQPVAVKVIEVAGGMAYVEPGRAAGVVVGTHVHVGARELTVIEVTERTATLRIGDAPIAIGADGTADARTPTTRTERLAPPRAATEFTDQWPTSTPPATTQHPDAVALGDTAHADRTRLEVIGTMFGGADKTGADGQGEARVISSFEIMQEHPLGADVDIAGRAFSDGWNGQERVPWFVRAAQLRYGDANDPSLMLGRLRYAATAVGMLDGGRAAAHVGDFELAAFGGLVPDVISGKPETNASRFGAELVWDRVTSSWQPRVAVVAYGSTWQGVLDERRLSVAASASHGSTWLDAWADAQQFPAGNPFNAPSVEITGAGASTSWRDHGAHLALDVTFLRPEQSLRLLAGLPDDWICSRVPKLGDVDEPCAGGDYWFATTASAGLRRAWWSIDAVGSIGRTHGIVDTTDASGYVRGEVRQRVLRLFAAVSGGRSEFADWVAPEVGVGAAPSRRFDIAVSYRPERIDYVAATGAMFMQALVVDVHYAASAALDLALSAVGEVGGDGNDVEMIGTIAWRPRR